MPSPNTVFHLQWICCQVRWYGLHAQGARREGRPQPARGEPGVARQGVDSGHVRHAQSWHGMMACHIHARLALVIPRQRQFFYYQKEFYWLSTSVHSPILTIDNR